MLVHSLVLILASLASLALEWKAMWICARIFLFGKEVEKMIEMEMEKCK